MEALSPAFTARDAAVAAGLRPEEASDLLRLLYRMGIAERVGKAGNAYLYRLAESL